MLTFKWQTILTILFNTV